MFGAITLADLILRFIPLIGWVLEVITGIVAFILWIILMVNFYQGQMYKLPVAGDIAQRQTKPKTEARSVKRRS